MESYFNFRLTFFPCFFSGTHLGRRGVLAAPPAGKYPQTSEKIPPTIENFLGLVECVFIITNMYTKRTLAAVPVN